MGIHVKGVKLYVYEQILEGDNIWVRIGPGLYVAERYLGKAMVKWI